MQRKTSIRTDGDRKGLFGGGTDDRRRQMRTNLRSITFVRKHTYKVKDDHSPPRLKERLTSCGTNMIQQAKDTLAGSLFLWVNPVSRTCGNATSRTHTHTHDHWAFPLPSALFYATWDLNVPSAQTNQVERINIPIPELDFQVQMCRSYRRHVS